MTFSQHKLSFESRTAKEASAFQLTIIKTNSGFKEALKETGTFNVTMSSTGMSKVQPVKKNVEGQNSNLARFPEDLIIRETVPGQDTAEELEMIAQSEEEVDVNFVNEFGHTSLSTAAFVGSMKCCKILIQLGAEVGKRDEDGWTAMHYAMAKGYLDIVKYLITCGGDIYMQNNDGDSPLEFVDDDEVRRVLLTLHEEHWERKTEA